MYNDNVRVIQPVEGGLLTIRIESIRAPTAGMTYANVQIDVSVRKRVSKQGSKERCSIRGCGILDLRLPR